MNNNAARDSCISSIEPQMNNQWSDQEEDHCSPHRDSESMTDIRGLMTEISSDSVAIIGSPSASSPMFSYVYPAQPFGEFVVRNVFSLRRGIIRDFLFAISTLFLYRSDPDELKTLVKACSKCILYGMQHSEHKSSRRVSSRKAACLNSMEQMFMRSRSQSEATGPQMQTTTLSPVREAHRSSTPSPENDMQLRGVSMDSILALTAVPLEPVAMRPESGRGGLETVSASTSTPLVVHSNSSTEAACSNSSHLKDSLTASASIPYTPLSAGTDIPTAEAVEAWLLGVLSTCIDLYCSRGWMSIEHLFNANSEFKVYVEKEVIPRCRKHIRQISRALRSGVLMESELCVLSSVDSERCTAAQAMRASDDVAGTVERGFDGENHSYTNRVGTSFEEGEQNPRRRYSCESASKSYIVPCDTPWVTVKTLSRLRAQAVSCGLVLLIHAAFSEPSCQTLNELYNMFKSNLQPSTQEGGGGEFSSATNSSLSGSIDSVGSLSDSRSPRANKNTHNNYEDEYGSTLSTGNLSNSSSIPLFGVVNAMTQLELVLEYNVEWYPTIIFIPPVSLEKARLWYSEQYGKVPNASISASDADNITFSEPLDESDSLSAHNSGVFGHATDSPGTGNSLSVSPLPALLNSKILSKGRFPDINGAIDTLDAVIVAEYARQLTPSTDQHITYPMDGIRQPRYLRSWFLSKGLTRPYRRRFKEQITRLVMMDQHNRYIKQVERESALSRLRRKGSIEVAALGGEDTPMPHTVDDPPVFCFLGGGMAAGKSTVTAVIESSEWWRRRRAQTAVIDADEFKRRDPLFSQQGDKEAKKALHSGSVYLAEEMMLAALNEGQDIIFDGTMMWLPFVEQTIEMIRLAHLFKFEKGDGYKPAERIEQYWEIKELRKKPLAAPYRIEFLGIFTDPCLAVQRGILRRLTTGRSVPIKAQLRSFRLFSWAFPYYANWVDIAYLFDNTVKVDLSKGEFPVIVARKDKLEEQLQIVDEHRYTNFIMHRKINLNAGGSDSLWLNHSVSPEWKTPLLD